MQLNGTGADADVPELFAAAMRRFGPFEPRPRLAVAVSGGPDSMALAVLAQRWARRRCGQVVALVVDHGLRAESRGEARATRRRLAALGIESRLLVWHGAKPATGIQAAARAARYGLFERWCARTGTLHLLTGHQRDDQAETVVLRRDRGSGRDGLAGMAAVVEREHVRILRPLLAAPRLALQAFLRANGVVWIDDPSNANPAFARSRARADLASPAVACGAVTALARDAAANAADRAAAETATARLLGRSAAIYPQGFARIARTALQTAPAAITRRVLVRLLGCVGGAPYPPRGDGLDRLLAQLRDSAWFPGATLAGCRLVPEDAAGATVLIVREMRPGGPRRACLDGGRVVCDGRFRVTLPARAAHGPSRITVAVLGCDGWAAVLRRRPDLRDTPIPPPARAALPVLRDRSGIVRVPHVGYGRVRRKAGSLMPCRVVFRPGRPLSPAEFPVA